MATNSVTTDRRLGWALLAAAVAQVVAPIVQAMSDAAQPADGSEDLLITPAGWTFSIWSLIYLLAIVHAVVTLWRGDGVGDARFVVHLIALYVGATVWIAVSATGASWATFVVLVVMTGFAIDAARRAARSPVRKPPWTTTLARATSGIYAGWVSAAVFLNLGTAAIELDLADPGAWTWQIVLLVAAAVFACAVATLLARSPGYALAVVWALLGIMVAVSGESLTALVIAAAAASVLVLQTVLARAKVR